jgi:exopolysaccharide biosynthesis polyprenyl glycosylphosphotransferase
MGSAGIHLTLPAMAFRSASSEVAGRSTEQRVRRCAPAAMILCEVVLDGAATALAVQLGWLIASLASSRSAAIVAQPSLLFTVLVSLSFMALLERMGAYRPAKSLLFVRETATLLAASSVVSLAIAVLSLTRLISMPFYAVTSTGCVLFLVLLIEKASVHLVEQKLHESGTTSTNVALCGTGLACRRLYSTLINSPKLGLWPSVVVDSTASATPGHVVESGYTTRRSVEVLPQQLNCAMLRQAGVEKILVIASTFNERELQDMLERAASCQMPAEICAGDTASGDSPIEHDDLDGIVMWRPLRNDLMHAQRICKRSFDAAASAILIVLFSPILVAVALAIKLTSPGNVLFRQERIGFGGAPFTILKFRSMHTHACGDGFSPTSGTDSRISSIGRILRKTSLDELPQLFNVLRGDMSLVGPRPEMPFIAQKYTPLEARRLEVLPGITGLWQISAHRKELIHNNMQYDLYYVRHRGFFMDIAILIHTVGFAMRGL